MHLQTPALICILLLSAPPTLQVCLHFILDSFCVGVFFLLPGTFPHEYLRGGGFEPRHKSDKCLALLARGSGVLLKNVPGEGSLRQSN